MMNMVTTWLSRSTLAAALPALLFCGACGSPAPGEAEPLSPVIEFEIHSLEHTGGNCTEDDSGPCARFFVEYPEITTAPTEALKQALNAGFLELILDPTLAAAEPAGLQTMADRFIDQWNETRKELPEAASVANWFMEHRVKLIYQDTALISVESAEEAYSGGAHPNASSRFASFALTDGHALTLEELLVPEFRSRLNAIAARLFREAREIPAEQSLTEAGFWFEDGFKVNDNFAVVETGLLFYFNAYEIGPYAAGPTKLVIPRNDLGDLVPPGSPLAR